MLPPKEFTKKYCNGWTIGKLKDAYMKVTLSPDFPDFYFEHRGVACKIRLGHSNTDRNGKSLYYVFRGYNHNLTKDKKNISASSAFAMEVKYKNKWDQFREFACSHVLYEHTQTQQELIKEAIENIIKRVNKDVDRKEVKKEAFDKIPLEVEIPE